MTVAPLGSVLLSGASPRCTAVAISGLPRPAHPTGWNQPTVRRAGDRYVRATRATSSRVTAASRRLEAVIEVDVAQRVEVPDLVRDVGDAVGLEHQPGAKLVARPLELGRRDAVGPHGGQARRQPPPPRAADRACHPTRCTSRCRETALRSAAARRTPTRPGPFRPARDRAACCAAAGCGTTPTGSRPWRQTGPRPARASARSPDPTPPAPATPA